MAEGNPKTSLDGGEDEFGNPVPLLSGLSKPSGPNNNSNAEVATTNKEN